MKTKKLLFLATIFLSFSLVAQNSRQPSGIITGTFMGTTGNLKDFPLYDVNNDNSDSSIIVPQQVNVLPQEENTTTSPTIIQNLQTEPGGITALPILQNFQGSNQGQSGYLPPDPTGAVGPDHYVHSVNSIVKIFDKTGNLVYGPISLGGFLGISSNNGDPIVMYDQLADRWFVSEFGNLGGDLGLAVGVSVTNDPTGAYNVYQFDMGSFPDYPHYGLWHDGYYGTANYSNQGETAAFVMERDVILAGGAEPKVVLFDLPEVVSNPLNVKSAEPANLLGTEIDTNLPGYITYLQDDGWASAITYDHLKVWEIDMDWNNVANSTISDPLEIPTDPFDAGEVFGDGNGAIKQPGTSQRLSGHGGIVSFAANYRPFEDHNSWLITFNTFIDANETGGIRWIELRNDDFSSWEIFQEGTYSIADGHSRLMSTSAMDAEGNIALAYTTASENLKVSLRYTGRFDGDPLGQMTLDETVIFNGNGVRTNNNRYGDYAHMTLDPDNFTFWSTADYFQSNNYWATRIASFRVFGPFADDVGVSALNEPLNGILTNSETVEISIRNYSLAPVSNIPVELRVDGDLIASENFNGTINPNEAVNYEFSQTVDLSNQGQTYVIEAKTNFSGDGYEPNDNFVKEVKHLLSNDVGVYDLVSPQSGQNLANESITVKLKNYGAASQSGFDVQYILDSGSPVIQSFDGTIGSEEVISFTFDVEGDFSEIIAHSLNITTLLSGDQLTDNDEISVVVENLLCLPESNCTVGHGFDVFEIAGINNDSDCNGEGYSNFTNLIANLEPGSTNSLTVTSNYGNQYIKVWIDFNDDSQLTADEVVVDNYHFAAGEGSGNFTETFDLVVPAGAIVGEHLMRARASGVGTISDNSCQEIGFGETEDYTANIGSLGVEDYEINNSEMIITTLGDKQFDAILNTEFDGELFLALYNSLGQRVGFSKRVPRQGNTYKITIDMSNMSQGVYFVRMGGQNTTAYKTGRIIVK
ncbi:MAG: T9SS type A sorting domain-containing protein [Flavobacteriaceae bacterium]|nr:T9SS type A sorting domain-containing protein [Flavobacteriaceae bacterium]